MGISDRRFIVTGMSAHLRKMMDKTNGGLCMAARDKKIGWDFGRVSGGVIQGFNNSNINLFGNDVLESVVRECIQNSIDAHDDSAQGPTQVAFTVNYLDPQANDVTPGLKPFMDAGLEQEKSAASNGHAADWYRRASSLLGGRNRIPILGIHDANTVGLSGTHAEIAGASSPWLALVRAQGVNRKRDESSLGGFGHGSNAPFGLSKLRTVFYHSPSLDEDKRTIERFQGHAILQTLNIDGDSTTPDGFYGNLINGDCLPLCDDEIPKAFREIRANEIGRGKGTSVYVLDPKYLDDRNFWKAIKLFAIANFAYAILKDSLIVDIDGERIDSGTLRAALDEVAKLDVRTIDYISDDLLARLESAKTVISPLETGVESVPGFGAFEWFMRREDGLPSKVGVGREPGMLITRRAPELINFNGTTPFDFFVCVTNQAGSVSPGAQIIKGMEDPNHTTLTFDRLPEADRTPAVRKYKSFAQRVRAMIVEKAALVVLDEFDIDLDEILGGDPVGAGERVEGFNAVVIRKGKPRPVHIQQRLPDQDGPGTGNANPPGGGGESSSRPRGPGGGSEGPDSFPPGVVIIQGQKFTRSPIQQLRIVPLGVEEDAWVQVQVFLRIPAAGNARLALSKSGETNSQPIEIRADRLMPLDKEARNTVALGNQTATGKRVAVKVWVGREVLDFAISGEYLRGI